MTPSTLKIRDEGPWGGKFLCELNGVPIENVVGYRLDHPDPGGMVQFTVTVWVGDADVEVACQGDVIEKTRGQDDPR